MTHPETTPAPKRGVLNRFLNVVERIGNRLPDPLVLYIVLAAAVPLLSWLAVQANWSAVHPATGEELFPVSLLTAENLRRMFTEAVGNFVRFPPLGTVLVTIIGIGVAERSGMIGTLLKLMVKVTPRSLISGMVVLAGVMSSMAADAGYVVLVPLGAVVFAGMGRHPLAGLCAAFAGTGGGFSANLFLTSLDPLLSGFTQSAAQLYDPDRLVAADANYYFMVVSTVVITLVGWWVTEKIVEPRLGNWSADAAPAETDSERAEDDQLVAISPEERWGLIAAGITALLVVMAVALLVIPQSGLLRDADGGIRPFIDSLVILIMLFFLFPGVAYGLMAGTCRTSRQFSTMTGEAMGTMGGYIVLAFAAAQFVAYFSWSNLGLLLAIEGADTLKTLGVGHLPLILSFVLLACIINLVIGSASAKWGIMAPVFVPMFMALGLSPEMTQATYRVGDSITNMVTPLNPYFPIILSCALRYDRKMGIGTLVSGTLPYAIGFGIAWAILLSVWYFLDLPLGRGAPIQLGG
ncbi:MAG: AbgT family transporter [Verrucomicrobiae bacterium]|nr:AbgT family transporter [Verrucomicrobiae bacterium]